MTATELPTHGCPTRGAVGSTALAHFSAVGWAWGGALLAEGRVWDGLNGRVEAGLSGAVHRGAEHTGSDGEGGEDGEHYPKPKAEHGRALLTPL